MSCYIQHLEQTKDGWHIRFGGASDYFWSMLVAFKFEQRQSDKMFCFYNPQLFQNKGGWFCTESIFVKCADHFENYEEMRHKAEQEYAESGKAEEETRKAKEQKEREARWKAQFERDREEARKRTQQEQQKNDSWSYQQKPTRAPSTALTLTEAKVLLGLPPITQLSEIEVKKAFRLKAMTAHPDHNGSHEEMIKLNQAYQLVLFSVGVKVDAR